MLRITSVQLQKKNPSRFNIFLDGQFVFGVDEDLIVEYRLVVGKVIDPPFLEKLLFEAEVGKLMERMYRLWNVRSRSEKEVVEYFRSKNYELRIKRKEQVSDLAVELVIKKLKQKGLLDDLVFAKAWAEARRRSGKKGRIALKQELFQKGIAKEIIEEVISQQSSAVSEEELARQALEKKMKLWSALSYLEKKKKMYEFLLRRGFEYEVVKSVVENLMQKR
ncbi:hypothetical protein A3H40_01085 [Candidatus Daviesbacteria bacterium RIFCSPLOWO2_02_FULL_38_15]|nr:MAG: hypothetical protein A3H40_01085 [Candidatus Daviesbacteria bacterium RIFCSPLOWO2_02_FULL_38_15]